MKALHAIAIGFVFALQLGAALGASEGALTDPTRPPVSTPGAPGGEGAGQVRVVQSVLIAPGRSVAVIDGTMVRVGSRLGEAQVMRISETGVVLKTNGRTETLLLLPNAQKTAPRISGQAAHKERAK